MSIKMRARLSDDLPFWFAMTSPLTGVLGGDSFWYGCWAGGEKP